MKGIFGIITATAAVVVLLTGTSRAQSKYNLVFLGQRMDTGDVRSIALGGGMQLLDDSLSVLQLNPATLTVARKVTFGAAQYFTSDRGKSDEFNEQDATFKFSSFTFAFPLTSRLSLALGYRGRYDADGHILTQKLSQTGEQYGEFYNRKGGLVSFPFTAAVHVSGLLRIGAYYSIEKGSFEDRWDIVFADKNKNTATSRKERKLSGQGYGVGAVLQPSAPLMLGVTYEGEISYDTEVRERFTNSSPNKSYTETTTLPQRWTFSALWKPHRYYAVHGAFSFSDFKTFEGLAFPPDRLYSAEVATVGVEYSKGLPLRGMRFPIRGSATYERLPYDFPAGERIKKLVFGFGTGLPFRSGKGKLDIALEGGTVGDRQDNGLSNRILRIYIGISGSEIWKRQRQAEF